ncbi:MAG: CRISPR-associated helicase Cas3' [Paracoccus sp. (in: a-proteobacteria)]|uniref:CRISPR-associated helicase Cas3' n=1 Tax=Paracoccus sp. TaxID=267 RepID=UPI0026DFA72B|nr:CRISPR-associated helicase Cas3' [Paracoccus sp. (in: a-proteobacteria)]MDO5632328.1 CRISPR-associated helicase Cas3' [Paracoccus sp. (in: a-proteobacteria)]
MTATFISNWPGKSAASDGIAHPAAYHMLDVAAVAERLISARYPAAVRDAVILLTALHDLGKVSDSFRAMLTTGAPQPQGRHWEVTEALLRHHDAVLALALIPDAGPPGPFGSRQRPARFALYAGVAGHHGQPPRRDEPMLARTLNAAGPQAVADAADLIAGFMALWPGASLAGLDRDGLQALDWWLPGFIAAADWVGSNPAWFPPTAPGPDLSAYLSLARGRAGAAIRTAGLDAVAPVPGVLFDFTLRPMQAACRDIALPDGPMLAVIEDETGAGKTEAALLLAQRMMLAGKGQGLFFALPTTATADAMFARARHIVRRMFDGPPSLTLAHGRAALSGEYRDLRAAPAGVTDAPVCTEWLAEGRRRALLATVGVGTIDQALLSVLPTRFATLRHYGLSSKILIVDEVHEMGAPYMATELAQLLRAHRMAGGSAILLTATLPLDQRAALLAAWGAGDDGDRAYPALTIAGGATRRDFPQTGSARGPVVVSRLHDAGQAVALLADRAAQGAACLWVRNAVDDAIAGVQTLRAAGVAADLLHARFALADRLRHEGAALARFGKHGQGRAGRVLVATQVVESSLDLDFDVMVSDLAPVASLIQRAGRLWRHMDLRPAARRPVPAPMLYIVSPDPALVEDAQWLHHVLDRGAWVYPLDLQWRSAQVLFAAGRIDAPGGLRALIEAAHGEDAPPVPDPLAEAELLRIGQGYAEANQARRNLIDLTKGYRANAAADDTDYPTRLGRPTQTLMLARHMNGVLRPWAAGPDGWSLSEVQVAQHRLRGLNLPDQSAPDIAALVADWPEWRRVAVVVCPVDEAGLICAGLGYDAEVGVVFGHDEK